MFKHTARKLGSAALRLPIQGLPYSVLKHRMGVRGSIEIPLVCMSNLGIASVAIAIPSCDAYQRVNVYRRLN